MGHWSIIKFDMDNDYIFSEECYLSYHIAIYSSSYTTKLKHLKKLNYLNFSIFWHVSLVVQTQLNFLKRLNLKVQQRIWIFNLIYSSRLPSSSLVCKILGHWIFHFHTCVQHWLECFDTRTCHYCRWPKHVGAEKTTEKLLVYLEDAFVHTSLAVNCIFHSW